MNEKASGLVKIVGITVMLFLLWAVLGYLVPDTFLSANNIENLLRRTALYGILGIGVAFVIISSGIDLSIGSLVCFCACTLALLLNVTYEPLEQTSVWQIDKATKTMLVSPDLKYEAGNYFWYDGARRETGLIKIVSVDSDLILGGKNVIRLTLDKAPRKDRISENGEPVGSLSQFYKIENIDDDIQVVVIGNNLVNRLGPKDVAKLVHPTKQKKERKIAKVESHPNGTLVHLADPASNLDTDYLLIPIKRIPFMSIPMALATVFGMAILLGLIHGLLITKLNQRPFVVTLCGLLIYRGLSQWITNEQTVGFIEYTDSLGWVGASRWVIWESIDKSSSFGIPYPVFVFGVIAIGAIVFLNFTIWGRYMLALGQNEEAARLSGINTGRMTILAYVICAFLASVGGVLFALDSNSITPSSFGDFFELYAIAAAVLGGCSLRGGEGSILGVIIGTALMQTLKNSIVLLGIPDTLELVIIGTVLLIGVTSDEAIRRLAARLRRKSK